MIDNNNCVKGEVARKNIRISKEIKNMNLDLDCRNEYLY